MYARAQIAGNSRDFVYARARRAFISSACKGLNAVNFVHARRQRLCNFQRGLVVLRLQGINILQFPGLSACKGSISWDFYMQELDVLHFAGVVCTKGLQMLLEVKILEVEAL